MRQNLTISVDGDLLKRARALARTQGTSLNALLRVFIDGNGVISTQVLQKFFVASTRKLGVAPEIARRKVGG